MGKRDFRNQILQTRSMRTGLSGHIYQCKISKPALSRCEKKPRNILPVLLSIRYLKEFKRNIHDVIASTLGEIFFFI